MTGNPPISMVPCKTCGAPSTRHFVGGSYCAKHWAAAFYTYDRKAAS